MTDLRERIAAVLRSHNTRDVVEIRAGRSVMHWRCRCGWQSEVESYTVGDHPAGSNLAVAHVAGLVTAVVDRWIGERINANTAAAGWCWKPDEIDYYLAALEASGDG